MISEYRWKPVLRGSIYCSPACGCKCTKDSYDAAVEKADALAKQLGDPWVPRVHENGNWFYGATIPLHEYEMKVAGISRLLRTRRACGTVGA